MSSHLPHEEVSFSQLLIIRLIQNNAPAICSIYPFLVFKRYLMLEIFHFYAQNHPLHNSIKLFKTYMWKEHSYLGPISMGPYCLWAPLL